MGATVLCSFMALLTLKRQYEIRPLEWGFLRLVVPTGIFYSLMKSVFIPPRPLQHILSDARGWRDMWGDFFTFDIAGQLANSVKRMDLNDAIEVLHSVIALLDELLASGLAKLFGEWAGNIIHLFLTIEIVYGLPIMVLSILLLRVWEYVAKAR